MELLLNSNIDLRTIKNIRGSVARIGGSVDQLVDYNLCNVTDINIVDGGFGEIKKIANVKKIHNLLKTTWRYAKQDFAYFWYGGKISRDRKTIILDMHDAFKFKELNGRFDAVISSNVIEHSPNPIFLLLNFYFITKKNGYQFHAIPHCKYTYDIYRLTTTLEHMINDFENETWIEDTSHNEDYIQSAIIKHGWMKKFHEKYPVAYPFTHYHVFDENITREIAEFLFEDVTVDIYESEKHSDNVIIFRNSLNKKFMGKYAKLIDKYFMLNF
jgi:SAM-dependent methyltransferase